MGGNMRSGKILIVLALFLCLASFGVPAERIAGGKIRMLVISSYHREYGWSEDTERGFCAAMLRFGYFDTAAQADAFTKTDFVETAKATVKKMWMDAKRNGGRTELERKALAMYKSAKEFGPDIIFLGDDEAGEYVGKLFLDAKLPVVFWGFNDNPVKYGLVDTARRPGHNVTGVYQSGYYLESLRLLKAIVPRVKTFAVLSDATVSGRTHYKAIEYLARSGELPLKLAEIVATNDYQTWQARALDLQSRVDAFYVVHYVGLKDKAGKPVPSTEVAQWYTTHIRIPETTRGHYVKEGMLCAADDSGYKQAYEAVVVAHDILARGANPATYPTRTPTRGALMVNRDRARTLGITLKEEMGIEEYIGGNAQPQAPAK